MTMNEEDTTSTPATSEGYRDKDKTVAAAPNEAEYQAQIEQERQADMDKLQEENRQLKLRVNELTALLYRLTDQFESDFFSYSSAFMQNQNLSRTIKSRLVMTTEVWDIVNKSKEQPEQS